MIEKLSEVPQSSNAADHLPEVEKTIVKVVKDQEVLNTEEENELAKDEKRAEGKCLAEEEKPFSYIEKLDATIREFHEPVDITLDHLKLIADKLGLIKLFWPDLSDVSFEDRSNFPQTYLRNSDKEKLLLLYAENFRRQICFKFPDRKPLFLACDNECGVQKMVCTTIRPTTLPYSQISSWEESSKFVADHVKFEHLEEPVLMSKETSTVSKITQ